MIRLIASDLDDTLLPEGTSDLNPEYFELIRALHKKGILFTAASGRHYNSMKRLLAPVKEELIFLCGNGTCVVRQDRLMDLRELDRELYAELLQTFHALDPGIVLVDQPDRSWSDEPDREALDRLMSGYGLDVLYTEDLASLEGPVLEIALHQDHFALGEPLADKFGCLAPAGDINEIRLTLFALLDEVAVNRNRDTAHRNAALRGAHLRISCQSAHQEYLVQHSLYLPCSVHGNAEKSRSVNLREHLPRVCALLTW